MKQIQKVEKFEDIIVEEKSENPSPERVCNMSMVPSSADLIQTEKQSTKAKIASRKRQVSECASLLATPLQAQVQDPGCLKWRTWLPSVVRVPCLLISL